MKTLASLLLCCALPLLADEPGRLRELDLYWAEVSRAVKTGDFEAYKATCHPEGVLVSGSRRNSQPLSAALERWRKDFDATRSGAVTSSVEFKFSQRLGDATTAHETGMFFYSGVDADGKQIRDYIHFEALLVRRDRRWLILMEYQKSKGTREEYEAVDKGK